MISSSASTKMGLGRKLSMLVLGALVACVGAFAFAGQAKAEEFNMSLDNGQMNLGFFYKGEKLLPASDSTPPGSVLNLWNPPTFAGPQTTDVRIKGDVTGGNVTIAQNDFQPPIMTVPHPTDPGGIVPITLRAKEALSGTFDAATGDLTLNGATEARVLVGLASSNPAQYCALALDGLVLSTNTNASFVGTPFAAGLEGKGALTGTFTIDGNAVESVGGADCAQVAVLAGGKGGFWLANNMTEPDPRPNCPEYTEGVFPDCVPIPCPEGTTGTNEPDCVPIVKAPKITAVTVTPKKGKVKAGKSIKLTVKVTNKGNAAGNVKVTIKSSNKQVKAPKTVTIKVAAGKTASKKITVKTTKKAKGKATITAKGAGKTGKSTLTVQKAKKKKK